MNRILFVVCVFSVACLVHGNSEDELADLIEKILQRHRLQIRGNSSTGASETNPDQPPKSTTTTTFNDARRVQVHVQVGY